MSRPHPTASALDEIATWIGQHPERLAAYSFFAARLMERDRLHYRTVFDRIVGAAVAAGRSEAAARTEVYKGFGYAAAGYVEPPPELEDGGD